jgi:hypothetical protein
VAAPRRLRSARGLLVGALVLVAGCREGAAGACGAITREALDPAALVHVLADEPGLEYGSEPPTSGPHQPAPDVSGVVTAPLPRPVQVGVLERGDVLLQHRGDLSASEQRRLEALAGDRVVVAPDPDLPARVVATAWTFKRSCDAVDVDALQAFVDERAGKGPEG